MEPTFLEAVPQLTPFELGEQVARLLSDTATTTVEEDEFAEGVGYATSNLYVRKAKALNRLSLLAAQQRDRYARCARVLQGTHWAKIAEALGISTSRAQQRYGRGKA